MHQDLHVKSLEEEQNSICLHSYYGALFVVLAKFTWCEIQGG